MTVWPPDPLSESLAALSESLASLSESLAALSESSLAALSESTQTASGGMPQEAGAILVRPEAVRVVGDVDRGSR